tara:strand:+ start:730 stop:1911 length:1182 start_codon:yes stop_codon:yes gene_type:complete
MSKSSFLSKGTYDQYGDPSLVYYSVDIINNNPIAPQQSSQNDSENNPPARFQEVRSTPIINNASNFELTIISADLNGATKRLPLFIPLIDTSQSDVNQTVYWLGMGVSFPNYKTVPIIFTPIDSSIPVPTTTNPQNLSNSYYFYYNYQQFLNIINTAFFYLATDLIGNPGTVYPHLRYNPDNGLFSLLSPVDNADLPIFPTIRFNQDLFNLFSSFPYRRVPFGTATAIPPYTSTGQIFNEIAQQSRFQKQETIFGVKYLVIEQEYNTTNNLWSPCASIVFATTQLPILNEKTSTPLIFDQENVNQTVKTSTDAFNNVLLEFRNEFARGSDLLENILYQPSAEFRMTSLTGSNTSISNIDIIVYWRNRLDNQLYQLYMPNFSNISIKLLFRRKN